jgi:hypothetical protein
VLRPTADDAGLLVTLFARSPNATFDGRKVLITTQQTFLGPHG